MQKQKQPYNYYLICKKLMPYIFMIISQLKKKIRTLGKISLLTFSLLIHLVKSNNILSIKLIKKTKITKEVFGIMIDKIKIIAKIYLQLVSILLLKRKKKKIISFVLNVFSIRGKAIMPTSVLKKRATN